MGVRRHQLSRHEFTAVAESKNSLRAKSEHLSVVIDRTAAVGGCAVVVSKKVAKTAVGRHLLKRRIRAILQPWYADNRAIIVYARERSAQLSYTDLSSELQALITNYL